MAETRLVSTACVFGAHYAVNALEQECYQANYRRGKHPPLTLWWLVTQANDCHSRCLSQARFRPDFLKMQCKRYL